MTDKTITEPTVIYQDSTGHCTPSLAISTMSLVHPPRLQTTKLDMSIVRNSTEPLAKGNVNDSHDSPLVNKLS